MATKLDQLEYQLGPLLLATSLWPTTVALASNELAIRRNDDHYDDPLYRLCGFTTGPATNLRILHPVTSAVEAGMPVPSKRNYGEF